MIPSYKPLFAMTAADLMTRPLVMVPVEMSLEGAARLLSKAQISGAPVVDREGRCVGVLSATDFMHVVEQGWHPARPCDCHRQNICSWQIIEAAEQAAETVGTFMTGDPVLVPPAANIGDIACMMLDAHIHRVIVAVDGRPQGVISATDVLAAVARAYRVDGPHAEAGPIGYTTGATNIPEDTEFAGCE